MMGRMGDLEGDRLDSGTRDGFSGQGWRLAGSEYSGQRQQQR
jgi:hypothetical protein